jgi:amidase
MPTTTDVSAASATTLAHAIAAREVSSVEVVDACLRRIEAVNPSLNAVVQLRAEAARAEAAAADTSAPRGPLHGVPVTIKDAFDVEGMISTCGTRGRAAFVPTADATVVARLRAAGAVVLGLTNTPELTLAYETDNLVYGRTNNPYDPTRTPGGSSGGEAALIAAGGSPLGVGTDVGGSLRVPAHYCGIASLKPTLGRVPTTGTFPPAFGAIGGLCHVGPMARSVEDLYLALRVLSGPDGRDPRSVPAPLDDPATVAPRGLRIAFFTDNGLAPVTPETARSIHEAARALSDCGAVVEEARPPGAEQAYALFRDLLAADGGATLQHLLGMVGTTEVSPLLQRLGAVLHPFAAPTAAALAGVLTQIDILRAQMLGFLHTYDAILSPVTAAPAVPHGTTFDDDVLPGFSYAMLHNLSGLPAAVVRAGTSPDGLPIGVQLVARPWREDVALALAERVEHVLGGWQAPL